MKYVIASAALVLSVDGAWAETLTECGKSDGYAYYFSGGLVPADKSGWRKDGIDGGRIILNVMKDDADLLIKNATGTTASVKHNGGKIYGRKSVNGLIALTVFYDEAAVTEEYVFQLNGQGDGTVAWTVIRAASELNKVSLMTAQCRGPR